jgi:hypothetical protein
MKIHRPTVRRTEVKNALTFVATRMTLQGTVYGEPATMVKDFEPIKLAVNDSLQLTFNWEGFDH